VQGNWLGRWAGKWFGSSGNQISVPPPTAGSGAGAGSFTYTPYIVEPEKTVARDLVADDNEFFLLFQ
jgi:hypothetical protein